MILGLRCSNSDYYHVLLSGTKGAPQLNGHGSVQFPTGISKPASLKWMVDEIRDRIEKSGVKKVVLKGPEPAATKSPSLVERVEYEAAAFIACAEMGLKAVSKKVKSTIAKDLGMKGRGKYLQTFEASALAGFDALPEKGKEAALAAWSELD
jgi:type IV pilus biogenesis protein CpaD/CtpE